MNILSILVNSYQPVYYYFMNQKISLVLILFTSLNLMGQVGPSSTWTSSPPATLERGEIYTLACTYDAGNDGAGTNYNVEVAVQFVIAEYDGANYTWRAGSNNPTTIGTESGSVSNDWTIPTSLPLSSELDSGHSYAMRISFKNNYSTNSQWGPPNTIPVTITDHDFWSFNADPLVFSPGASLDIPIEYTSDLDIAPGGIRLVFWTETKIPFSDKWYGVVQNSGTLPAGENVVTTINVAIPGTLLNSGAIRLSSDLGPVWDPNAGDEGNTYTSYNAGPPVYPSEYFYNFRIQSSTDSNFDAYIPSQTPFIISATAGVKDYELKKIAMYPNPASQEISVEEGDKEIREVRVYDITGKEVIKFNKHKNLNISDLAKGMYLIKTDTGRLSKFIKE